MTHCESRIADFFQKRFCILTGNATSALSIAFERVSAKRPNILLPAMACYNIVMAVCFAGKNPVFADVLEHDATLDPAAVERALKSDPSIGAVLIVHLYGNPARTHEIIRICREHDVLPIEDQAQAMGGYHPSGEPLGALGDMSIVSFGHTKILDVGGGGALLMDDPELYQWALEKAQSLPARLAKADELETAYRQVYYGIWRAGQLDPGIYTLFDHLPLKFKSTFIFREPASIASRIGNRLDFLRQELEGRRIIADIYRSELVGVEGLSFFSPLPGSVPWRFTFRLDPQIRDSVFDQVRRDGFDISGWYPCFTDWTPSGRKQGSDSFPVANILGNEVTNLWVAEAYTPEKAVATVKSFKKAIKRCQNQERLRR